MFAEKITKNLTLLIDLKCMNDANIVDSITIEWKI
jgi:hypothetical protein